MSSATCGSCNRPPSFCCYCSEIPVLVCDFHLITHQRTTARHMITPYTYAVTEQQSKLLRKISELLSSSQNMISSLISIQTQHIEYIQSTLSSTISKFNSYHQYLDNLYAEVSKISHLVYKPSNTPVEKVLLAPDIDEFLGKITEPGYYCTNHPGDLTFIPSNLQDLLTSVRPDRSFFQTVNPSKKENSTRRATNFSKPSKLDEPKPIKRNTSNPNLNIKKDICIGCSKFAAVVSRQCGHESCNDCLGNRCPVCELNDESVFLVQPSHLPKSKQQKGICRSCTRIEKLVNTKCGHKYCEPCSHKPCMKCFLPLTPKS